jgi:ArsR family transcriptional regulator, arsenate/arsenite/antimonite-responsive transcriptional repressor
MSLYFYYSGTMEMLKATEAFESLSQETRLRVFKLLIEYGRDGAKPGIIAEELKIPGNTLSFHLSHMSQAGLITFMKDGRFVTYFANTDLILELIGYLQANCCTRENRSKTKTKTKTKAKARAKACNERKC